MPQCPTIQIRMHKLIESGTHTLSMNIRTPSEIVISRLAGEDCFWHCCISNIEAQEKFLTSRGLMGIRGAMVLALKGLGIHLESISTQRLSFPGRWSIT